MQEKAENKAEQKKDHNPNREHNSKKAALGPNTKR